MLKLYKLADNPKQYWETWEHNGSHTIHWGELGTNGQSQEVRSGFFRKATSRIQAMVDEKVAQGFLPVDPESHHILLIEYEIDGFGTQSDLEKRHRLEDRMNETLGWTGLGECDGGSIGSGTMEVCTLVVDFEIAKAVIEEDLKGTEYSDFSRIYEEGAA